MHLYKIRTSCIVGLRYSWASTSKNCKPNVFGFLSTSDLTAHCTTIVADLWFHHRRVHPCTDIDVCRFLCATAKRKLGRNPLCKASSRPTWSWGKARNPGLLCWMNQWYKLLIFAFTFRDDMLCTSVQRCNVFPPLVKWGMILECRLCALQIRWSWGSKLQLICGKREWQSKMGRTSYRMLCESQSSEPHWFETPSMR